MSTEQGFVSSTSSGYSLTEQGQAKADQCWNLAEAHAVEAFGNFDDEQVDSFRSVLRQLIDQ